MKLEPTPYMQKQLSRTLSDGAGLAAIVGVTLGAAVIGAWVSPGRSARAGRWFRRLRKPAFQPPARVFGPVWSALYPMIALSGYRALRAPESPERSRALGWWAAQLGLNGLWSPLFFGLRRPLPALADSVALLGSTANYARHAHRIDKPAAWLVAPYLGWLAFATVLNAAIARRNG